MSSLTGAGHNIFSIPVGAVPLSFPVGLSMCVFSLSLVVCSFLTALPVAGPLLFLELVLGPLAGAAIKDDATIKLVNRYEEEACAV